MDGVIGDGVKDELLMAASRTLTGVWAGVGAGVGLPEGVTRS